MKQEKSCGAIVYHRLDQEEKYLLIQHENGGHWSFPKGHVENDETEVETALREIKEETGINVRLNTDLRLKTSYLVKEDVEKEVIYFIGLANDDKIQRQEIEVTDYQWLNYEEALELITYSSDKALLSQAHDFIHKSQSAS